MDFELDDDQRELQDTVRGIVDKECSPSFVRSVIDDGIDPAGWWATMVELYWPALAIAEDHGGLGMGWVELAILLEELGRATDPSPFVATTTQFAPAIAHCGDAAQQARWLGGVAAGSITGALALGADTVTADGDRRRVAPDGSVRHVVDGDRADEIAVVATVMDENGDGAPAVFVVERTTAGLTAERTPAFDYVVHIADVTLHDVRGRRRPASRRGRRGRRRRAHRRRGHARLGDPDGRRLPAHPRHDRRLREGTAPVRRADRIVPGRQAQGGRHVRRRRAGAGGVPVRGARPRRGRSAHGARRCRWPRPPPATASRWRSATASSCSAGSASPGRTISRSASGGPSSAKSCSAARSSTVAASRQEALAS